MGYVENIKSIMQWGNSFERQGNFPLDRTDLHISYDDAVLYAKGDASDSRKLGKLAYIGQTITVWGINEKGVEGVWVYSLVPHIPVDENDTTLADLKPVGAGAGTEIANNYTDAVALSKGLVVGQLIKVTNDEVIEETVDSDIIVNTYKAGFYIVDAPGVISPIGLSGDIESLEAKVDADIANLSTHIAEAAIKIEEVDSRLEALDAFVEAHESIKVSDIEDLFAQA
jgi:hypothetical protein